MKRRVLRVLPNAFVFVISLMIGARFCIQSLDLSDELSTAYACESEQDSDGEETDSVALPVRHQLPIFDPALSGSCLDFSSFLPRSAACGRIHLRGPPTDES